RRRTWNRKCGCPIERTPGISGSTRTLFFTDLSSTVIQDDVFERLMTFPNTRSTPTIASRHVEQRKQLRNGQVEWRERGHVLIRLRSRRTLHVTCTPARSAPAEPHRLRAGIVNERLKCP